MLNASLYLTLHTQSIRKPYGSSISHPLHCSHYDVRHHDLLPEILQKPT